MKLKNYQRIFLKSLLLFLSVILLGGGCASSAPPKPVSSPEGQQLAVNPPQLSTTLISRISAEERPDTLTVIVSGSEPLIYEVSEIDSPPRLIVEVTGAKLAFPSEPIPVEKGVVKEIFPAEQDKEGKPLTRIEVVLNTLTHYEVLPSGNNLEINFPKLPPALKAAENVFDFSIDESNKDFVCVNIVGDGTIAEFNSFNLRNPTRLVIDFYHLQSVLGIKEKESTSPFLRKARWGNHGDYLRLVLDSPLAELPDFDVIPTEQGATIFLGSGFEKRKAEVMLKGSSSPPVIREASAVGSAPETTSGAASPSARREKPDVTSKIVTSPNSDPTGPQKNQLKPLTEQISPPNPGEIPGSPSVVATTPEVKPEAPRYTGTRISLDFKDADIRNILRLIAEVSNLNIVAGDDVQGTVTIKLNDVPWDQALDVILLSNNLGKSLEGNIIRIAPIEKIEKQKRDELAAREMEAKLEPLKKGIIPVSYAQASQLRPVIQNSKVLSPRGSIEVDPRTNTLIVIDIEKNIEEVKKIIDNLDTPTPQVLIEAKIIQINPSYTKELGIKWGGDFQTTASGGTGAVAGSDVSRSSTGSITTQGTVTDLLPSSVGIGTGASIAWGYFRRNFDVFQKIAAMEKDEKLEVISSPRVLTLDNQEALIEQGTEVPYLKLDTQSTQTTALATTEFKKVTLSLKVIPHVTPDGSVIMEIEAKKDQVSSQTGAGGQPGVDTRKAITKVLVRSGDTVVIGGIYEDTNRDIYNSVPFFGRLPIFSFFFKGTTKRREKTEMIVFITPTIVQLPKKPAEAVITPIS